MELHRPTSRRKSGRKKWKSLIKKILLELNAKFSELKLFKMWRDSAEKLQLDHGSKVGLCKMTRNTRQRSLPGFTINFDLLMRATLSSI